MQTRQTPKRLDLVQKLILVIIPLGLLHHADHVGRADHASWPFRPEIGPFTFTLLIYPVLLIAFYARDRHWVRVVGLGVVSLGTLFAHTLVEPPQQIYGTWAHNRSTDAILYTVDPEYMHNLWDVESPLLGGLAAVLSSVLTVLLLLAWVTAIVSARAKREDRLRPAFVPRLEILRRRDFASVSGEESRSPVFTIVRSRQCCSQFTGSSARPASRLIACDRGPDLQPSAVGGPGTCGWPRPPGASGWRCSGIDVALRRRLLWPKSAWIPVVSAQSPARRRPQVRPRAWVVCWPAGRSARAPTGVARTASSASAARRPKVRRYPDRPCLDGSTSPVERKRTPLHPNCTVAARTGGKSSARKFAFWRELPGHAESVGCGKSD